YDIVFFAMSPWANLCGCDGVDREFRCRYDCVSMQKNGKSEGNIEGLLKLRDAALQLGISFPTIKQWIYKKKIRSNRTAGGHHRIPQSEVDRLLFRTRGKTEQQRKEEIRRVSGRNQLVGRIESVQISGLMAEVRVSIGGQQITSIITARSAREMQLKRGQTAAALIKATDVMVLRV
ncbi:MAG: TOBE domain-containing protein, partial [Candidatus Sulfotelmatobacter sp.]